jgi:transcription initiation factor TFIID subunit 12
MLLRMADDFIDQVSIVATHLAKHRQSDQLSLKDIQFPLETQWNIRIPGFLDESKNKKRMPTVNHQAKTTYLKKAISDMALLEWNEKRQQRLEEQKIFGLSIQDPVVLGDGQE